jgi:phosphoadenosine phosphosulfate reductase
MRELMDDSRAAAAEAGAALAGKSAEESLAWALARFGPRTLVLSSSFGPEDVVLIDMFSLIGVFPRVVTLDTGRLPQETYDVIHRVRERYPLPLEVLLPEPARVAEVVERHGPNLFYESVELRRLCCRVRKVEPLRRALAGAAAWITGVRREQAGRAAAAAAECDEEFGLVRLNPLASWTSAEVWTRVRDRNLPYNRLHDEGYPSVGCSPCTRAVAPGADPRSGRWWWESPSCAKECGLNRRPE